MDRSISEFFRDNYGRVMSSEAIRDVRFGIPVEVTPNRILSVKVFRQDDFTEQSEGVDYTVDKQKGKITLIDSGNWDVDTVFISKLQETGHGSFTNKVEILTKPKENRSDPQPFVLIHSLPMRQVDMWNTKIATEFEEDGVIRGEKNQKFRMRVQIDLQAETHEQMLLMYFELTRLGTIIHMPYFEWVYGVRVQKGWIRLGVDLDVEDPEWDYPRKTIDYKGFLQRQEFEDYATTQNLTMNVTTDSQTVTTTGFEIPAAVTPILTFDDDFPYTASPEASIEDANYEMFFG